MPASNGKKYIVDDSVETGKEKEMLTSGDMLLSVIPGPWSTACDLGVPFWEEGGGNGRESLVMALCCLFCLPHSLPALHVCRGFSVFAFEGGTGQVLGVQSKHSGHHALPLRPSSPPAFSPLPLASPPEQISRWFRQKSRQNLMLLRGA